jgi:hypothetical protein
MGRNEALPFSFVAAATSGQLVWVFLNRLVDYDERERRVHLKCLPKLKETRCEVCGEPVDILADYITKYKDKIYSPREYMEYLANLTEEEKEERQRFFAELFRTRIPDNRVVDDDVRGNGR